MSDATPTPHMAAAEAFVERVNDVCGEVIERIVLDGSVARGEMRGANSDVDLTVVIRDEIDQSAAEDRIRQVAYGNARHLR